MLTTLLSLGLVGLVAIAKVTYTKTMDEMVDEAHKSSSGSDKR
jgi:hypothetical protein